MLLNCYFWNIKDGVTVVLVDEIIAVCHLCNGFLILCAMHRKEKWKNKTYHCEWYCVVSCEWLFRRKRIWILDIKSIKALVQHLFHYYPTNMEISAKWNQNKGISIVQQRRHNTKPNRYWLIDWLNGSKGIEGKNEINACNKVLSILCNIVREVLL